MSRVIAIDPGISKCGVIIADIHEKKVYEALVIKSNLLLKYVQKKYKKEKNIQCIIGNGTSCKNYIKELRNYLNKSDKANFELEVVSLINSKTAQPVIVGLNINYPET